MVALGVGRVSSLAALAAEADVLSVHCDLNPSTRRAVDQSLLLCMRRGSFVVNTARGGIVDEAALRAALDSGHIAGAGIDVHEKEPFVGTWDQAQRWCCEWV
jgi:D-3-phosphoglycerate dehydrogenase